MSKEIEIEGNGCLIVIYVLGYENPDATNSLDANWLKCLVRIKGNGFSFEYPASLTTHDFFDFEVDLKEALRLLKGDAILSCYEDQLGVSLSFAKTGLINIRANGKFTTHIKLTVELFFNSDPSVIAKTADQLIALLEDYPIKKK